MAFSFNPFTGTFDITGMTADQLSAYYKLNGSNTNGKYYFGPTTYFVFENETLELYVNGSLRESWTNPQIEPGVGEPIGLLLALTKA